MERLTVGRIADIVSGTLAWGDGAEVVTDVVIDSRKAGKGSLFVPIIGERVDAHKFIPDVLAQGAAVTFSSDHTIKESRGAGIYVEDTLGALQSLAAWYRSRFSIPVIGITGSVGKTTTKEMIASVLETRYRTVRTIGNQNSQIGLSLMMFHLDRDTEIAVFEMGISMPGEMDRLVEIAKPTVAVMTNIGVSHIGNLGSRENICREKGKIIENFPEGGTLYVCGNGDLRELSAANIPYGCCKGSCGTVYYGTGHPDASGGENECYGDSITPDGSGQMFVYHHGDVSETVRLSVTGNHNVNNAIVAMALAERFDVPAELAKEALFSYKPLAMRGEIREAAGVHIIDDSYNASPDSIESNLDALLDRTGGNKIAVLADVLELGEKSEELHRVIGDYIVAQAGKGRRLSLLVTVGEEARYIQERVGENSDIPVIHCRDNAGAVKAVKDVVRAGDWVLVKGSRGMHMEEVAEGLVKG